MRRSNRGLIVLSAALLVAASATGCRRTDQRSGSLATRVGTATLTGALVYVPTDIAREQLAQARCEHATSCGHVGEGKRYRDPSDCTVRVQLEAQGELDKQECPAGVDEIALRDCVDQIAHGACSDAAGPSSGTAPAPCETTICRRGSR